MNTLDYLNSSVITDIIYVHDYIQIITSKGAFNAYNPVYYNNHDIIIELNPEFPLTNIVGKAIIQNHFYKDEKVVFILDDKNQIEVSLLPADYVGPEAMDIQLNDGRIIVIG